MERLARLERTAKTAVITAALEAHLRAHEQRPDLPFVGVGRSDHGRLSVDSRAIARRQAGRAAVRG